MARSVFPPNSTSVIRPHVPNMSISISRIRTRYSGRRTVRIKVPSMSKRRTRNRPGGAAGERVTARAWPRFVLLFSREISDIESEVDHVAVLNRVLFAFEPELPRLAAAGFALELDQVLEADDLRANEAALDIRVDLARGPVRGSAALDRPGAALVLARREKAYQVEPRVGGANEPV